MPKIKKPPPRRILNHPIGRYHDGRIEATDFLELKHWLESDPERQGKWYKRFKTGILAGNGETPSTSLAPGMSVEGEEVE